jgi:DNA helicase-2/ATP-dependent DNA helicase PcrA
MMYLEGPLGSGKTSRLVTESAGLLQNKPASGLLVLCSNHTRQQQFLQRLLSMLGAPLAQLPVYTFAGFVRNTLFNYWPLAEAEMAATLKKGQPRIRPELSGLEDTELMLKWLLQRLRQEAASRNQNVYADFPGNDNHILKQIIRRLRLRSENLLSRKDMLERSILLDEMCREETAWLEKHFDLESYTLRVLDPNKQLDIFNSLLKKDNPMSRWLKTEIKHLVVDDVDETIAAQQRLIEALAPSLETLIMAADIDGGSRRGYLNAYPYDWQALKNLRPGQSVVLARHDSAYQAGQTLLENWRRDEAKGERFIPLPSALSVHDRFITRAEMLEQVVEDILDLIAQGRQPGDFCIVLPKTDLLSFHQLQSRLSRRGIPVQLLSGTKRPSDNPKCRAFVYLIQWANSGRWQTCLSPWEIKTVLTHALQFQQLPGVTPETMDTLVTALHQQLGLQAALAHLLPPLAELCPDKAWGVEANLRYAQLADWLLKSREMDFNRQLYSAFDMLLAPYSTERDGYNDLNRIIMSYLRQREIYDGFRQEAAQVDHLVRDGDFERWWLQQVKSGTVADTPDRPEAIHAEALVIGTPQKVIDNELYRKVQCWLDIGSREWARSDNAPLYNAWVHSAVWDGSTAAFTEAFNESVIRTRAGHITRTLMLLATEQVRAYASELDDLGFSQIGLLKPRLLTREAEHQIEGGPERAILRPDQAPILDYHGGTMSISAVPGAGKTFVNVELLLELIQRGIAPDCILVLTYMDSAAKTLLGRLKKKLQGFTHKLPVVSTIHSLAFRILTENDHAQLAGFMPDDMTILDDYARGEVLGTVAAGTQPESTKNVADWQRAIERGISQAKMFNIHPQDIERQLQRQPDNFRLAEFLPAYRAYCQILHQNGYLDFTDLIVKAVGILRDYPDVRRKYQQQFAYIIEDEAQDSSRMLQDFIRLLTPENGLRPNLIRTGDTNQSITTTFSSADTSVFRDFIQSADLSVSMDHSGRCAPEVIDLANTWMARAAREPGLENAFEQTLMKPVPGKNPQLLYPLGAQIFDLDRQEEEWLIERIQHIRAEEPDASIAVLVRSNTLVNRMTGLLHQAKIPAVSLSEQMNVNPVFTLILAYLKLLASPGDLESQAKWHQLMVELQLIPENQECKQYLENTPLFYQEPSTLSDEMLKQWVYDWLDLSRQAAGGNIGTLIARIADLFFRSVSDRSNGYLCALMAQDILNSYSEMVHLSPLEIVIHQFEAFQKSWRGKKSFTDVLLQHPSQVVQVMSMHKSKGQEFDVVFMPFLQSDAYPSDPERIRFDEADRLLQDLDRIAALKAGTALPADYQGHKKREKIEEEARLIYVGLTRAKRALYLSAHSQSMTRYHKLRTVSPALAFELLSEVINKPAVPDNVVAISEEVRHARQP